MCGGDCGDGPLCSWPIRREGAGCVLKMKTGIWGKEGDSPKRPEVMKKDKFEPLFMLYRCCDALICGAFVHATEIA